MDRLSADDGFSDFWHVYPRKLAKADARKAWKQTAAIRPPTPDLIKAVIVASSTAQWIKDGGAFIPYPATWIRGERWADIHEIKLANVVNGKMWYETVGGIELKGAEMGLHPTDAEFERTGWPGFRAAVMARANNVVHLKSA